MVRSLVSLDGDHLRISKAIPFIFVCLIYCSGQCIIAINEGSISFRLFCEKSKHSLQT